MSWSSLNRPVFNILWVGKKYLETKHIKYFFILFIGDHQRFVNFWIEFRVDFSNIDYKKHFDWLTENCVAKVVIFGESIPLNFTDYHKYFPFSISSPIVFYFCLKKKWSIEICNKAGWHVCVCVCVLLIMYVVQKFLERTFVYPDSLLPIRIFFLYTFSH